MIHFAFLLQTCFQLDYLGNNIAEVLEDKEANDLIKNFKNKQKFWHCLFSTQGRITLELSFFSNFCEIVRF